MPSPPLDPSSSSSSRTARAAHYAGRLARLLNEAREAASQLEKFYPLDPALIATSTHLSSADDQITLFLTSRPELGPRGHEQIVVPPSVDPDVLKVLGGSLGPLRVFEMPDGFQLPEDSQIPSGEGFGIPSEILSTESLATYLNDVLSKEDLLPHLDAYRGYRGVRQSQSTEYSWQAYMQKEKKQLNLGTFDRVEKAALAYDKAIIKDRGLHWCLQAGRLNFTELWRQALAASPHYAYLQAPGGGGR